MSHESVRTYYHRLKEVIKSPGKKSRKLIAIETKIKLENKQIFVWMQGSETGECLSIWASESRGSFEAYVFLREVLKHCENKPELLVSKADNSLAKARKFVSVLTTLSTKLTKLPLILSSS